MENKEVTVIELPSDLMIIANQLPTEKKDEVSEVLNMIFAGTSEWKKQVEGIVIKDINDKLSMQMADVARKTAKNKRLEAVEVIKAKRENVKMLMLNYTTEDKLWLKAQQIVEILFKEIETIAKDKAEYAERFEANRKEMLRTERIELLRPFCDMPEMYPLGEMTEEAFTALLDGFKSAIEKKQQEEARLLAEKMERERLDKVENNRRIEIAPYLQFITGSTDLRNMSDADYQKLLNDCLTAKKKYDDEQEAIRSENERLKKEAEEKEAKAKAERLAAEKKAAEEKAKIEAEKKTIEEKARKEREAAEAKAAKERAEHEAKLKAEREKQAKLEAELAAQKEAEAKRIATENAAKEKAEKERLAAEKKAAAAPDKIKIAQFCIELSNLALPVVKSEEAKQIVATIEAQRNKFVEWIDANVKAL